MSLISEALKRQQLEKDASATSAARSAPGTTPVQETPPPVKEAAPPPATPSALLSTVNDGARAVLADAPPPPPAVIRAPPALPRDAQRDGMRSTDPVPPAAAGEKAGPPAWLALGLMCLVVLLLLTGAVVGGVYAYRRFAALKEPAA